MLVLVGMFVCRSSELLRASAAPLGETCVVDGVARSRRELVLTLGDLEAAQRLWSASGGEASQAPALPSCVRGHSLHARCFQTALLSGQGCPACDEPLWVPGVNFRRGASPHDATCCEGGGSEASALEAASDAESSLANGLARAAEAPGALIKGQILR